MLKKSADVECLWHVMVLNWKASRTFFKLLFDHSKLNFWERKNIKFPAWKRVENKANKERINESSSLTCEECALQGLSTLKYKFVAQRSEMFAWKKHFLILDNLIVHKYEFFFITTNTTFFHIRRHHNVVHVKLMLRHFVTFTIMHFFTVNNF